MSDQIEADANPGCPWCSASVSAELKKCPECGAALAQRDTIGDLVIPGVTHVDPGLQQFAKDPLRIPGASPAQSIAGPAVGAAIIAGGPAGLVALAGLGAVAAGEYMGANRGRGMTQADLEKLGQPSEAAVEMLKRLEEDETTSGAAPRADKGTPPTAETDQAG